MAGFSAWATGWHPRVDARVISAKDREYDGEISLIPACNVHRPSPVTAEVFSEPTNCVKSITRP